MKSAFAIVLAATAAALPAQQAATAQTTRFEGLSLRSGSPIHFGSINANGQSFWIGKNTTTYCPEEPSTAQECAHANKNTTVFVFNGGSVGLDTVVPGGQQVYVSEGDKSAGTPAGQIKFTQAHSTSTSGTPLVTGFSITSDGDLQFEKNDWVACPSAKNKNQYEIFAASRIAKSAKNCLGFSWRAVKASKNTPAAWQYTK